jgi:hypothetical protein
VSEICDRSFLGPQASRLPRSFFALRAQCRRDACGPRKERVHNLRHHRTERYLVKLQVVGNSVVLWPHYYSNGVRQFQPRVASTLGNLDQQDTQLRRSSRTLTEWIQIHVFVPRVEATLGCNLRTPVAFRLLRKARDDFCAKAWIVFEQRRGSPYAKRKRRHHDL